MRAPIFCPECGNDTGHDQAEFANVDSVTCPHCGELVRDSRKSPPGSSDPPAFPDS